MPDNLNDRGPQDRSRISMSEQWEIDYWTMEFGCSESELSKAVEEVGNSADEVREYLSRR
jgi:hypothetical protein